MDKLGGIDSPATKAYVALTAKHRAIDLYRSRRRCEPADISGMQAAEIHYERLGVMEALDRLPSRDRDMLLLRFWEGCTTDEIAGMLRMKKDAVCNGHFFKGMGAVIGGFFRSGKKHKAANTMK